MVEFGMHVKILHRKYGNQEYNNVTEVHHNYPLVFGPGRTGRIAFESDIHGTGITWTIADIIEMEVTPETELAEAF